MGKLLERIRAFQPPLGLSCLLCLVFSTAALLLVFTGGIGNFVTIPVYVCAAVAMAFCTWAILRATNRHAITERVERLFHRTVFTGNLYDDFAFRTVSLGYGSLGLNLLFSAIKGLAGWQFSSYWLISLAVYYLLLCLMKLGLLHTSRRQNRLTNEYARKQLAWHAYCACGVKLMLMTIVLQGMVVLITTNNEHFTYDGLLIYPMALYDFVSLTLAILFMVRQRRKHTPIVVALKIVRFAASLVSILSLQTAMFASFGDGNLVMERWMNLGTGSAVCIMLFLLGLYMRLHGSKERKALSAMQKEAHPW